MKKVHILQTFHDGAWGGGNQFLKALRAYFIARGVYTDAPDEADILLHNSYPFGEEFRFRELYAFKKMGKTIIHRLDGPIFTIRNADLYIDKIIYQSNVFFAAGTIFQSAWSKQQNILLGYHDHIPSKVILNAPNEKIFYSKTPKKLDASKKIKIIATSWSDNMRKGFPIYAYLDEHLDFTKYEMTFVGNTPIHFKNITVLDPVSSEDLAEILRAHDIYITASSHDPCSNALIEALHCGLPAVVLDDGGHPEIIKDAGKTFKSTKDVLSAIDDVAENYTDMCARISVPNMQKIGNMYYEFMDQVAQNNTKKKNSFGLYIRYIYFMFVLYLLKILHKIKVYG